MAELSIVRKGRLAGERGNVLVLVALVLPVLLGFGALALDAGYFFDYRQQMSAAADAAAVAGAFEIKKNSSITQSSLETYARSDATRNGFLHNLNSINVTVERGTYSGSFAVDSTGKYVRVTISRPTPTFLMAIFGASSETVGASAVAGPQDTGSGCVYALNSSDTAYPTEFNISASGVTINTPNCGVISNGDLTVHSGSSITAKETDVTASTGSISGTVTPAPTYNTAQATDPFIDMDQSALFGTSWTCDYTSTYTFNSGTFIQPHGPGSTTVFCGNPPLKIAGSASVAATFPAGLYVLVGSGIDWKHTLIAGTGVTFYFTGTATYPYKSCGGNMFSTDPPDTFNLSAPTSGPYEGLLFVQDRKQGTTLGNPSVDCTSNPVIAKIEPDVMNINGVIYFPNHHIVYDAATASSGNYTILVGGTLQFDGTAVLNSDFSSLSSGSPVKGNGIAE